MLESSKDLFYLVLSFCVLWLTIFLCWLIYYLTMTIKRWYEMIDKISHFFETLHNTLEKTKDKIINSAGAISGLNEIGQKIFDLYKARKAKKKTK